MSLCFITSEATATEETDSNQQEEESQEGNGESQVILTQFWEKVNEDIRKMTQEDFKQQVLPLTRVKKIMKLDEDVKMISAEAPFLFAKAAEIFIHELTLRAWTHTVDNKRRTLQRNDLATAIIKSDQFDFLIDIVPRQEWKPAKAKEETSTRAVPSDQVHYYFQLAQQHQAALQNPQQIPTQIQAQASSQAIPQLVQVAGQAAAQPTVQLIQQFVTPNGELQQIPIQLNQNQLNLIRMQMQSGSNQPIIIQSGSGAGQSQLLQVSPQAQQPHPVYLTQVASTQESE